MDVPLPIFRLLRTNKARAHLSVGKQGGNCAGNESGLFAGRHDELVTHVVCSRVGVDSGSVGSAGSISFPSGRRDMFLFFCFFSVRFFKWLKLPFAPPPHPSTLRCLPPPPPPSPRQQYLNGAKWLALLLIRRQKRSINAVLAAWRQ